MVTGVVGYGYSGSGAVLDFLCESSEYSWRPEEFEFDFTYLPGGLEDLEYQLMERKTRYLSSNAALKAFKRLICNMGSPRSFYTKVTDNKFKERSLQFIDEITQISWRGYIGLERLSEPTLYRILLGRKLRLIDAYEKHTGKMWPYSDRSRISVSVGPENFYKSAHDYIKDILVMMGYDLTKPVLLNQPFDAYDPRRSMKYFDDPKAIVVDRDPRDIYVLAKCSLKSLGCFIPTESVGDYIKYHRLMRNSQMKEGPDLLLFQYEDLVYDYKTAKKRLRDFLGLSETGWQERKYFDPDRSIDNTQLFLQHPELEDEIRRIEQELPEYLYPFENYAQKPLHRLEPFAESDKS